MTTGVIIPYARPPGQSLSPDGATSERHVVIPFSYIRSAAQGGDSPTAEIARAKELLDSGAITADEYAVLKQTALARAAAS